MLYLLLAACGEPSAPIDRTALSITPGPPRAGVAERPIDFPVGAPLGGYSSRCSYLGGDGEVDKRQSAYSLAFSSSAGIQTRPMAKALWLENGDQHLVILKADVIYSYDNLVEAVEDELIAATGEDLDGRVTIAASHTHNAPANFSDQIHFYLGGDRYNEEVFRRFVASLTEAALAAYDSRDTARIGLSIATDWDPEDRVYHDRRKENDALAVWDDAEPGYGKDPHLWMLRVDDADGDPLGVFFNFGVHGTSLGNDNAMISTDSTGHIELALQERFDTPVVVSHLQGAGGDASPSGDSAHGQEYAVLEGLGEAAADTLYAQWEATATSADPISLETVSHAIPQSLDQIAVSRDGAVDWRYAAFNPDDSFVPDDIIYDESGEIISPIDEFNVQYGGVFCGYNDPLISAGTIGSAIYPYNGCMNVELISFVLNGIFSLEDFWEGGEAPLPLPSSLQANTTASLIGDLTITTPEGDTLTDDLLIGFFPGETTAMYTEQFRRRAQAELGISYAMVVGYAQDHEGYLLIPEDWLLGGYEPNINVWGPLQGEHIMEGMLEAADQLLTEAREPQDPQGLWQPTTYPERDLPTLAPDTTAAAGQALDAVPDYLFVPPALTLPSEAKGDEALIAVQPPAEVPRVQGIAQLVWEGGDPGVDTPLVVLEREEGGVWEEVTTPSGRAVTSDLPDILLTYTPDPLYPFDAPQQHTWWASWQAVDHAFDRPGMPTGTYRLHVYGHSYDGGAETWPWPSTDYEVISSTFAVTTAAVSLSATEDSISAWLAGPSWGYRLVDMEGSSAGANPLTGATLSWLLSDGTTIEDDAIATSSGGITTFAVTAPDDATYAIVTDAYGNSGQIAL